MQKLKELIAKMLVSSKDFETDAEKATDMADTEDMDTAMTPPLELP